MITVYVGLMNRLLKLFLFSYQEVTGVTILDFFYISQNLEKTLWYMIHTVKIL